MQLGRLTPQEAMRLLPQMCDALQYAHDHGVVHRDIKPENILVDQQGHVRIADFGLAKLTDKPARDVTLTGTAQSVGTPHYMAPEQLGASRDVDHRADIYALGVVFYEMLTGQLPIGHFQKPSQAIGTGPELDGIVLRALAQAVDERYQQAREVKSDVENAGRQAPVVAPRKAGTGGRSRLCLRPIFGLLFFLAVFVGGTVMLYVAQAHVEAGMEAELSRAAFETQMEEIRAWEKANGTEWTGELPERPVEHEPGGAVSFGWPILASGVLIGLLVMMYLGFSSIRRIREDENLHGMGLAVFLAWLPPKERLGLFSGDIHDHIAAVRHQVEERLILGGGGVGLGPV